MCHRKCSCSDPTSKNYQEELKNKANVKTPSCKSDGPKEPDQKYSR